MNKKMLVALCILMPMGSARPGAVANFFEDVGNTINKEVIQPTGKAIESAANTVNEKVIKPSIAGLETAYKETANAVNIAVNKIVGGWAAKQKIGKNLIDGAKNLAAAPNTFRKGIEPLKKMPEQLAAGQKDIRASVYTIYQAINQINTQIQEIQSKDVLKLAPTLANALNRALGSALTALNKVGGKPQKEICREADGTLCKLHESFYEATSFLAQKIREIEGQIDILQQYIDRKDISGRSLPSRMEDLGKVLAV